MATGKRYYWIKLKESFMGSDEVDYLMSRPNGANYIVLYQMLCLKTINTEGKLSHRIGEILIPYDLEKIQRDCKWFSIDTIRVALNLYKSFGLIYEDQEGTLILSDHHSIVGSETDYAVQKKAQRQNQMQQLPPSTVDNSVDNVHTENRDKILDMREEEKEFHPITPADFAQERQRTNIGGSLGKGVLLLSDEQTEDLLNKLSLDEFNRYCKIVVECELKGKKFKKKTHYQAILDMAIKDRKILKGGAE